LPLVCRPKTRKRFALMSDWPQLLREARATLALALPIAGGR